MTITGTAANDRLGGTTGNDSMAGGLGDDFLYGSAGNDTAVINSNLAKAVFGRDNGQWTVSGADGNDTISGFESLQFNDHLITASNTGQIMKYEFRLEILLSRAAFADGSYVCVSALEVPGSDLLPRVYEVYVQRFGADGKQNGNAIKIEQAVFNEDEYVDNYYNSIENNPVQVVSLSNGGFAVTWSIQSEVSYGFDIYSRTFDSNGVQIGSDAIIEGCTYYGNEKTKIVALDNGYSIFCCKAIELEGMCFIAQRFDNAGNKQGDETIIFDGASLPQGYVESYDIAVFADGTSAATWFSEPYFGEGHFESIIYYQRFDSDGNKAGDAISISNSVVKDLSSPKIATLSDGSSVIAWQALNVLDDWYDWYDCKVYVQKVDAAGNKVGTACALGVGNSDSLWHGDPAVTVLTNDNYIVYWMAGGHDFLAQRFDSAGNKIGNELVFNSGTYDYREHPVITASADGGYLVSWSTSVLGDTFTQHFDANGNPDLPTLTGNNNASTITFTDTESVKLLGLGGNDKLQSGSGNDYLDGGAGADTLTGNDGNDTYVLDNAGDVISEKYLYKSIDTVLANFNYTLGLRLENLTLYGNAASNGTGNELDNTLTGNNGNNVLSGGAGFDNLSGGLGNDTLIGGVDNDIYQVNSGGDVVIEEGTAANEIDIVNSTISYTLGANLEYLFLSGYSPLNATGNSLDNVLAGNASNNNLKGGTGNDTLFGDAGNDTAIIASTLVQVTFSRNNDAWVVSGLDGSDTLHDIENIRFNDGTIQFSSGGEIRRSFSGETFIADTAVYADGSFINLWVESRDSSGDDKHISIYAQRYDADGNKLGNEIIIDHDSLAEVDSQIYTFQPKLTTLSNGGFVIGWESVSRVDYVFDVYTRTFDGNGNRVGDDMSIHSTLDGDHYLHGITALGNGYMVTWGEMEAGLSSQFFAQRFDSNGNKLGAEITLGTINFSQYRQIDVSDVVALSDGAFVIAWKTALDINSSSLYTQRFDSAGNKTGAVNLMTGKIDTLKLMSVSDGGYLLAWVANNDAESSDSIYTQRFDAAGNKIGNEALVTTTALNEDIYGFSMTALANGAYVLSWSVTGSNEPGELYAQMYDNAGDKIGNEVHVNTTTEGEQYFHVVMALAHGGYSIGWNTWVMGMQDFTCDIYDQEFDAYGNPVLPGLVGNDRSNTITFTDSEAVSLSGLGGNDKLQGGSGNDQLDGGSGNDILNGGAGNDIMDGGSGNDAYLVDSSLDVVRETSTLVTDIDTVKASTSFTLGANIENLVLTGNTAINATGNALNNTLTGNTANNALTGFEGNDTLTGGSGHDTLTGGTGNDKFVISSLAGIDTITDLVSNADDIIFAAATIAVGDGDAVLEGKLQRTTAGGFGASNELVIFTADIVGAINNSNAALAIGTANAVMVAGSKKLFVVDNGTQSNIYLFTSANGDALVSGSELKLLATMNGVNDSVVGDYLLLA